MRIDVKKRGLSPVIASVLMILLVLVLASMIFLRARSFIANQTENSELSVDKLCSHVSFNAMVNNEGNILEVINRGNVGISAFEVKMYSGGDSEIVKFEIGVPIGESVSSEVSLGVMQNGEPVDKVEIFPVLSGNVKGESSRKMFTCYKEPVLLLDF